MNKDNDNKNNINNPKDENLNNDSSSTTNDLLENQIKELNEKVESATNNWKRALADYNNLQKRFEIETQQIRQRANEMLLLNILPVIDNMELLLKHSDDQGFKMIHKELNKVVQNAGLTEIKTENEIFDLNTMEAIETKQGEEDKVLETITKGYMLNGKLIRPAKVVVGKNKEEIK